MTCPSSMERFVDFLAEKSYWTAVLIVYAAILITGWIVMGLILVATL